MPTLPVSLISILYFFLQLPELRAQREVCGVGGVPARHDRQRLGLAGQRQGGLQQGHF